MPDDERDILIERVAASLRAPVRVDPVFDARVAAAIRHRPGPARSLARWLVRPQTVALSPLAGLALAACAGAMVLIGAYTIRGTSALPAGRASMARTAAVQAPDSGHVVQFILFAPAASTVALAGDFNDWSTSTTPMHRMVQGGVWSVTVPLRPGRYVYCFVVNGRQWMPDPLAPPSLQDDYGLPNSVMTVGNHAT